MSHVTNPNGFRVGKTFLWLNNDFTTLNTNETSLYNINTSTGIQNTLNSILNRSNYFVIKSSVKIDNLNNINVKCLYYPLFKPILRNNFFPKYYFQQHILNLPGNCNKNFKFLIKKLWNIKKVEYNMRFLRNKKKLHFSKWITKLIFKGYNKNLQKFLNKNIIKNINWRKNFLNNKKNISYKNKNFKLWSLPNFKFQNKINNKLLSKQVSKRIGLIVNIKTYNIHSYLFKKNQSNFNPRTHQLHIWLDYHKNKWYVHSFFDIVNSIVIMSKLTWGENFVTKLVKYSLLRMSKRRIQPKRFFYFLDKILKTMPNLKNKFKSIRFIITGKLRGGTSRTKTFSVGFGSIPRQSIDTNIHYSFDNIHSKYGSYGIKLLTWRK